MGFHGSFLLSHRIVVVARFTHRAVYTHTRRDAKERRHRDCRLRVDTELLQQHFPILASAPTLTRKKLWTYVLEHWVEVMKAEKQRQFADA